MAVPFSYKETKALRLARVLRETGGLMPVGLELGVGPGGIAAPLSRQGMRIVGVDLSLEALGRAKEYCRGEQVALVRGSGFSLPFGDASFPVAYALQVLHLFDADGRLRLMREVRRVLRPGSRFVFDMKNVLSHPFRYWSATASQRERNFPATTEVQDLLRRAGFTDLEFRPGVIPGFGSVQPPNTGLFRAFTHTLFYVARTP